MSDYIFKKVTKTPIPIGKQEHAYQKEDVYFDFTKMHKELLVDAYPPSRGGKFPYPNDEKDIIDKYELSIKHSYNGIEVVLQKKFKDGRVAFFTTFFSFSEFVNQMFFGQEAAFWIQDAPPKSITK